jgi:hypothetical protein
VRISRLPNRGDSRVPLSSRDPRRSWRVEDRILSAFNHACQQGNLEIAGQLLGVYEMIVGGLPTTAVVQRRRAKSNLAAAHDAFWGLLHKNAGE